jgi:anti-sigma-K factor RskA
MELSINQIRESGILELYALGELSVSEIVDVQQYISTYPELKNDLLEIEAALYQYAKTYSISPDPDLLDDIKKEITFSKPSSSIDHTSKTVNKNQTSGFRNTIGSILLFVALASCLYLYLDNNDLKDTIDEQNILIDECEELRVQNNNQIAILNHIDAPNTKAINIEATPKYPETEIVIYTNKESKQNILQLNNLPTLAANESFQLWSLGEGDPTPMDFFDVIDTRFLNAGFVDTSTAYAITIEAKGGAKTPNLDRLIGVFKLG